MVLQLETDRHLSEFSTFGIGGPVRYFAKIETEQEMEEAFSFIRKEKIAYWIVGKGSNTLFPDEGFEGIALFNKIHFCNWQEKSAEVGAGYSFSLLGAQSARRGLLGLEFAVAIPASVGGAIFMNAGANGKETAMALASVDFLFLNGTKQRFLKEDLHFSYRTSSFQSMQGAILSARFTFSQHQEAKKKQLELFSYREKTQPLKEKSAGCIFQNPENGPSAGALIEEAGLKGYSIGGASVSPLHANFIVNRGDATMRDVVNLIEEIQKKVYEKRKIVLKPEVRIFGISSRPALPHELL